MRRTAWTGRINEARDRNGSSLLSLRIIRNSSCTTDKAMAAYSRNILVVDDEPENLRFLGRLLADDGYQVRVADSGERALEALGSIAGEERPDLILLDVLMPAGMDGIETCRRIKSRERMRTIPVIFLTGKDDRDTMVRAFDAGGADYVLKPINTDVLRARVRAHSELGRLSCELELALAERTRELREANEKLRRLALEISLTEERERKRLARDLHDSPMQGLALAQMQFASAARRRDDESDRLLETGLGLLSDALAELRSVQFEISPPLLYEEGLAPALRWLASHTKQRFALDLTFAEAGPAAALDQKVAVVLFQCARELVHNLVKHAKATRGWVELITGDGFVHVVVADNGIGMPPSTLVAPRSAGSGYGLFSVQERLALLGGVLSMESLPAGTRAEIRVPSSRPALGPSRQATDRGQSAGHPG